MKIYTENEVITMLTNNMNSVMKLIDNKYYTADYQQRTVFCYRKNIIFKDELLSEYTFDYIIREAQQQL